MGVSAWKGGEENEIGEPEDAKLIRDWKRNIGKVTYKSGRGLGQDSMKSCEVEKSCVSGFGEGMTTCIGSVA